ncbi:FAD-dependent oxidoreductase [Streptomyces sp. NPDC005438]|uniref:NAD(P)/FAD-dependent oxidoreductase n=1 Tax=Streptomyces sp. NPDC005438 TaxID=3156880 RepID=UPI0033A6260B
MSTPNRQLAVVGSGVAGLTAAHVLSRAGERPDVTLFEADDRLGGHAHTHEVTSTDGRTHPVDSGFLVHNRRTYPSLLRLFDELGVTTQESEMSMSVSCQGCGLEYAGARGLRGLFPRPDNLLRGRYLRMLAEVPRFHRRAARLLAEPGPATPTLGEFLRRGRFSPYFVEHFVTPLVSAVWSCAPRDAPRYPARYLFRFLDHHGMLGVTGSPRWRTVTGGSREYVRRVAKQLTSVRTGTPVRTVRLLDGAPRHGVELTTDQGAERFDAVVIATHPDQALALRHVPTDAEREVLGAFRYSPNPTVLHTDPSPLPRSAGARASWNVTLPSCRVPTDRVRVSYHLNRLQRLDTPEQWVVSLNEGEHLDPARVVARMTYHHPLYTPESVAAQERLPELNGPRLAYAGAYHGWGFHEDGCRSGVEAARALGVRW